MNTPLTEHSTANAHQQWSPPLKPSEPADAVVADKIHLVKKYRRPLITLGLLAGGLTVALMAGWSSQPVVKDPRLQSPWVEVVKAQTAGSKSRTFTGIVEARVQSDLGFRV